MPPKKADKPPVAPAETSEAPPARPKQSVEEMLGEPVKLERRESASRLYGRSNGIDEEVTATVEKVKGERPPSARNNVENLISHGQVNEDSVMQTLRSIREDSGLPPTPPLEADEDYEEGVQMNPQNEEDTMYYDEEADLFPPSEPDHLDPNEEEDDDEYEDVGQDQEQSISRNQYNAAPHEAMAATIRDEVIKPGGIISGVMSKEQRRAARERASAIKYLSEVEKYVTGQQEVVAKAAAARDVAHKQLEQCKRKSIATPRNPAVQRQMRELSKIYDEAERELFTQMRTLDEGETELLRLSEVKQRIQSEEAQELQRNQVIGQLRMQAEAEAAKKFKIRAQQRAQAVAAEQAEHVRLTQEALEVAELGRQKTLQRIKEKSGVANHVEDERKALAKEKHEGRVKAVLSLKKNTEQAVRRVKEANESRAKGAAAARRAEEARAAEILARGGNPYEEKRKEIAKANLEAQLAKLAAEQKAAEMRVAHALQSDAARYEKDKKVLDYTKGEEARFRRELGPQTRVEHMSDYVKSRTIGGRALLDPTSAQIRLYPSKLTTLKDWSFGLGMDERTLEETLQKVQGKHQTISFDETLLPKLPDENFQSESNSAAVEVPEAEMALEGELLAAEEDLAYREFPAVWEGDASSMLVSEKALAEDLGPYKSKLEATYAAKAAQRQRDNIIVTQKVWGKEWTGPAFIPKPEKVEFKDFEVGKVYKRKFTLTNVSFTRNIFRAQDLPDEIRDFFDVDFKMPGHISAGLAVAVTVTFAPKLPEDIFSQIPFLAETGAFGVPLICTTKKCALSLKSETLDFGTIILGEEDVANIEIVNDGALPCHFTLIHDKESEPAEGEHQDSVDDILSFEEHGEIVAYDTTIIPIKLLGVQEGDILIPMLCKFDRSEVEPMSIFVKGFVSKVPIHCERESIDFDVCFHNHVYRDALVLFNRSHVPLKVQVETPPELAGHLEFLNSLGFVQGHDSFAIQMKFSPGENLLEQVGDYRVGEDGFAVPVRIFVPDQVVPVFCVIKGRLTLPDIELSPQTLDFGAVYLQEGSTLPLTLKNPSTLPVHFGFLSIPPELSVFPCVSSLAAGQARTVRVSFSPLTATSVNLPLKCSTTRNRVSKVQVSATGLQPFLQCSTNVLHYPPTELGGISTMELRLFNPSETATKVFEIALEPGVPFRAVPCVSSVPPLQTVLVVVSFLPRMDALLAWRKKALAAGADPTPPDEETPSDQEETTTEVKATDEIPQNEDREKASEKENDTSKTPEDAETNLPEDCDGKGIRAAGEKWSFNVETVLRIYGKGYSEPQHVLVTAAAVKPLLTIVKGAEEAAPEAQVDEQFVLDFGAVSIGSRVCQFVRVANSSEDALMVQPSLLAPFGAFTMLSAPRSINGGQSCGFSLAFSPSIAGPCHERLTLHAHGPACKQTRLSLLLKGQAVAADVSLDAETLDLGDVLPAGRATRTLTLRNRSPLALPFAVTLPKTAHGNQGGLSPWDVTPISGMVAAEGEIVFTVAFVPDHASRRFAQDIVVSTTEDAAPMTASCVGRCWPFAVFCDEVDPQPLELIEGLSMPGIEETMPSDLQLTLGTVGGKGTPITSTFMIGCTPPVAAPDGKAAGGNGEFTLDPLPAEVVKEGWALDTQKLTLEPGARKPVTVTFTPPDGMFEEDAVSSGAFTAGPGMWATAAVKMSFKGGLPAPPGNEWKVTLTLRAFLSDVDVN
jgi:hypothetical protein